MRTATRILAAALLAGALAPGVPARGDDFAGYQLRLRSQLEAQQPNEIHSRLELGYEHMNRTFIQMIGNSRFEQDIDFHMIRFGGTGYYNRWFLSGGFEHSVDSDISGVDAIGFRIGAGYQFDYSKNFTVSPYLGYRYTRVDDRGTDIGLDGIAIGGAWKWAPGYSADKQFARWLFFGSAIYYPDLNEEGFGGNIRGCDGFRTGVGVQHYFNSRLFGAASYGFTWLGAGDRLVSIDQEDHSVSLTFGYTLR